MNKVELVINVPKTSWLVICDPTQIHQVLLNFCVNARDAMPRGGLLAIDVANEDVDEHQITSNGTAKAGPHVAITVSDTGMGIPRDHIDKIFEPFFTTKELGKGTGLGLATASAIVRSHGGFITVQSELGAGSKFTIHLPADNCGATAAIFPDHSSEVHPPGEGETILIIDDEASVRSVMQRMLEKFGYKTLLAVDGPEALSIFAERRTDTSAVIIDMMMPIMDGVATIHAIRTLRPNIPIIAASGLSSDTQRNAALSAGANEFLPKPYSASTLLPLLRKILEPSKR